VNKKSYSKKHKHLIWISFAASKAIPGLAAVKVVEPVRESLLSFQINLNRTLIRTKDRVGKIPFFLIQPGVFAVAYPECLSRISDPDFFHPGSRILDSSTTTKARVKKFVVYTFL
jgi:hypothetical protein